MFKTIIIWKNQELKGSHSLPFLSRTLFMFFWYSSRTSSPLTESGHHHHHIFSRGYGITFISKTSCHLLLSKILYLLGWPRHTIGYRSFQCLVLYIRGCVHTTITVYNNDKHVYHPPANYLCTEIISGNSSKPYTFRQPLMCVLITTWWLFKIHCDLFFDNFMHACNVCILILLMSHYPLYCPCPLS